MINKIITINEEGLRLDKVLSIFHSDLSRNKIQKLIDENKVFVNNKNEKSSYKVKENDVLSYELDIANHSTMKGENIDIDVVYEDDDVAVINKAKGMVVHPGNGNYEHTLANALINRFANLSSVNGDFRPGIVHRIDKDTTGLLVVAKNDFAHQFLGNELKEHNIVRKYFALVKGEIPENSGKIIAPIGRDKNYRIKMNVDLRDGKEAITHFKVITRYVGYTFIECVLETGRTHQIRVHMNYIGYPLVGDPLYGKNNKDIYDDGQLLHAHEIRFTHPRTHKEVVCEAPLPEHFIAVLNNLKERKK